MEIVKSYEDHIKEKYIESKRVPHATKSVLQVAEKGTQLTFDFGDHQLDRDWYNYEEEIEEP